MQASALLLQARHPISTLPSNACEQCDLIRQQYPELILPEMHANILKSLTSLMKSRTVMDIPKGLD